MKNKILASLLAVCLFAGLAVPAFAEYYSSVEGDATKATIIDFFKDGKVIKELTIKNGESQDVKEIVRVFENKDTLILDKSYLNYSLKGDALSFGLNDSTITAIDDKGTTTVVVSSTLDSKIVAELKVTAVPAAAEKFATGFRFKETSNTAIAGAASEGSSIKVVSIPAGSKFNVSQQADIDTVVRPVLADVLSQTTLVGDAAFNLNNTMTIHGLRQGETLGAITTTDDGVAGAAAKITATLTAGVIAVTVELASDAAASTISVANFQAAIRRVSPNATVVNNVTSGGAVTTTITTPAFGDVDVAGGTKTKVAPVIAASTFDDNYATLVYTVPAANTIVPSVKKVVKVTTNIVDGNNGSTLRSVTASTSVQAVAAKAAINIGGPGSITIEVGEVYDTDGKMAFGPSGANVDKAYTLTGEYFDTTSDAMDYAAIDSAKILGVKVGKNKIVATLTADPSKTATIVVNVVAKGTKPATPAEGTTTTVLSAWAPKIGVGETANIVVKATKAVTYTSLDTAIATVDAAGKLTAVKEGTAKIKVQEEGKDAVYVSLTVTAKTTTPGGTTDVPQTAVVALAPLF